MEVHRQFQAARHQVPGLRSLGTQLGRLLVDADHLPRETLQPGLRVERFVVKFDPLPQLSNLTANAHKHTDTQGAKILITYILLDTYFHHCLQSVIIRS